MTHRSSHGTIATSRRRETFDLSSGKVEGLGTIGNTLLLARHRDELSTDLEYDRERETYTLNNQK